MSKSRDELKEMLPHVFYTFRQAMAVFCWRYFEAENRGLIRSPHFHFEILANAALESTLGSLRTLDEFFSPASQNTGKGSWDDCRAYEFPGFNGKGPFLTRDQKTQINQMLSHLSWQRRKPMPGWQVRLLADPAISRMLEFLAFLRSEFLSLNDKELVWVVNLIEEFQDFTPAGKIWNLLKDAKK
jgi:hypothetical protein